MDTLGDAAAFGGALALANQILHVLREVAIAKVNDRREMNGKTPLVAESVHESQRGRCVYADPDSRAVIDATQEVSRETLSILRDWNHKIDRGFFSCVWKDRDEVRDILAIVETSAKTAETTAATVAATSQAVDRVVSSTLALVEEIRRERNGRK